MSLRLPALLAVLLASAGAAAEPPTLHWQVPLPTSQGWRIVDLREGKGVRHEEYIPRGQGVQDYRDRIIIQRFNSPDMSPEAYLGHIATGLAGHCRGFTTSGLVAGVREGLPHATRTAYCGTFNGRDYGYVIAQKAFRDGDHLFIVEREWRVPGFFVDATGMASLDFGSTAEDEALKKDIRQDVRWLTEQVNPGGPATVAGGAPAAPRPAPEA
ncbi:hypothetical protein, partial [Zoogloea sp.]|uniref:hypothetical protein n=1 Tax=Zoogloea sp. TaxID=49181 RepID=UPI001415EA0E